MGPLREKVSSAFLLPFTPRFSLRLIPVTSTLNSYANRWTLALLLRRVFALPMNRFAAALAFSLFFPAESYATDLWREAADHAGVPVAVLHGIALAESGKTWSDGSRRPWPWTLNSIKGPMFFASRDQAASALSKILQEGITNVDIGLMQVNYGYHGSRVKHPSDLLDPAINLRVAGQVLAEARDVVGGDVASAVGAYHAGYKASARGRSIWYQNTVAAFARRLSPQRVTS